MVFGATMLGIVLVLLLGAYGHGTTEGFAEDVQGIARLLQRLLVAPVNIFTGIVAFVIPIAVIVDLAVRREPRRILEVLGAGVLGFAVALITTQTTYLWGADELIAALSVRGPEGTLVVQLPAYTAAVSAMLTAAGLRSTRRTLSVSWNILWIASAVTFISGIVTLTGAITVVLIGRACGLLLRYILGSTADRAYGASLVEGLRRAGFEAMQVVRLDRQRGYEPADLNSIDEALGRTRSGRVYKVLTVEGHQLIAVALDGDQQAAGFMARLWDSIRLRGIDTRAAMSLRQSAESIALTSHAARTAGVRCARVLGMTQVRDTMLLVYQRPTASRSLADLSRHEIDDVLLDAIWSEVSTAHRAGISHRQLSAETILVGDDDGAGDPAVWITSWEMGEVAASSIARRIDTVQVIAMLATLVGPERAVTSAFRNLSDDDIGQLAPLLQTIILPRTTRHAVAREEKLLQRVRSLIVHRIPDADMETENLARFGWRTIATFAAAIVAVTIVLTSFNAEQTVAALQQASLWWLAAAFVWGMLTFVGAALAMIAFSPVRLPWPRVLTVQVAAAYIALAVPAGIGPAALNLRMLTRQRVPAPLAVATVALVQVSASVVTVGGLLVLSLFTGAQGTLSAVPSSAVLGAVAVFTAVMAVVLLVPMARSWLVAKVMPPLRQTWPRLVQMLGQPWRLALGLTGNLVQTIAYVGAFYATLQAFGQQLAIIEVAVVFFLSSAVGAVVPTPGGLGAVEAALIAGLSSAGVPIAVATPVVIIYRLITYWARIPLGYAAMRLLQRRGEL